mgnify:CR=1 FL=1
MFLSPCLIPSAVILWLSKSRPITLRIILRVVSGNSKVNDLPRLPVANQPRIADAAFVRDENIAYERTCPTRPSASSSPLCPSATSVITSMPFSRRRSITASRRATSALEGFDGEITVPLSLSREKRMVGSSKTHHLFGAASQF